MPHRTNYSFIRQTLRFSVIGLFIPGLTVFPIVGLQMGIGLLGIECSKTWTILWTIMPIGALIAPIVFVRLIYKNLAEGFNLNPGTLTIFNVTEYTFIQCSLATFITSGSTLCYVIDGQNGIQFVLTGWMAIPFLIVLSLVFDRLRERRTEKLYDVE